MKRHCAFLPSAYLLRYGRIDNLLSAQLACEAGGSLHRDTASERQEANQPPVQSVPDDSPDSFCAEGEAGPLQLNTCDRQCNASLPFPQLLRVYPHGKRYRSAPGVRSDVGIQNDT